MNGELQESSWWVRSTTLRERFELYLERGLNPAGRESDLAEFRMQRWRDQAPFAKDYLLGKRLELDGLSFDQFFAILGSSINEAHQGSRPSWFRELVSAFEADKFFDLPGSVLESAPDARAGFLHAVAPLLNRERYCLTRRAREIAASVPNPPFDPERVADLFLSPLVRQLIMMMSPTMVLEMHVAGLQDFLMGESPEERFSSFIERLRRPEVALALLTEYPVLARQAAMRIRQWSDFVAEFLAHLVSDWSDIERLFSPMADPGWLAGIQGGTGDRHHGGRSVLIARFSSGLRVVYKPRALSVDRNFQRLLTWLNDKGNRPEFRTLTILDRGSYGWVEHVEHEACSTSEEVAAFYERQGGYLALLYALHATDFHYENMIAAGEHPVLVDLESLFHPQMSVVTKAIERAARSAIVSSVLTVGLLPQKMFVHAGAGGVDVSGLGARDGQFSPQAVPHWEGIGTQDMRMVRKRVEMPRGSHLPALEGVPVNVLDYVQPILAGFRRMYGLLREHREEILAPGGPLSWFSGDPVRVIVRPTRAYALLLQESFHPDLLRDGLDRDRHFDRLWVDIENRPFLERLIPTEQEALRAGDIPLFTAEADSRDLCLGPGERTTELFGASGLGLARERFRNLGDEDLDRQLWVVRASLATLAEENPHPRPRTGSLTSDLDSARLLSTACLLGDRLEHTAIQDGDEIGWMGLARVEDRFSIIPLTTRLYDGLPGVALFLAYLGQLSGEERYSRLARATLETLQRQLDRYGEGMKMVGGFEGWGAIIYVLTHLGVLWDEPGLLDEASSYVSRLPDLVSRDEALDVIDGSAGCIASLLCLDRFAPSEEILQVAVLCGDHIIGRAEEMPRGIAWRTHIPAKAPLAGLAHGAAGFAWTLLELSVRTGEERFRAAALQAIEYERSLFSPEASNWPDFRIIPGKEADPPAFVTSWCFGATGIGLARLRALEHVRDEETATEVRAAVETTRRRGFGFNHSLCHGDLGNLELLLQADLKLGVPGLRSQWQARAAAVLEDLTTHGPRCATPMEVESPGFMTGYSGIGYQLLRLSALDRVPSVLLFEPPPA